MIDKDKLYQDTISIVKSAVSESLNNASSAKYAAYKLGIRDLVFNTYQALIALDEYLDAEEKKDQEKAQQDDIDF